MLNKLNDKLINELVRAIISIKDKEECYSFLEDLCTISEIKSMAQRLEVAKMLEQKMVYSEIAQKTGSSTATISRVKRALDYGTGGYKTILQHLEETKDE